MTWRPNWVWLGCFLGVALLTLESCGAGRQRYADRFVNKRNRHVYVNDALDFSVSYFDHIARGNQQTDSLNWRKTQLPPQYVSHLKRYMRSKSEVLFRAYRTTLSCEDIMAVLYRQTGDAAAFSKKLMANLTQFVPKDSLNWSPYQTAAGYWVRDTTFIDGNRLGSMYMRSRIFSELNYAFAARNTVFKVHEFHVPYGEKWILRLIWVADVQKTNANTPYPWQEMDRRNHFLELFSLSDSAKFRLKETIPNDLFKIAQDAFVESGYSGAVAALADYEEVVEKKGDNLQKSVFYQSMMTYTSFLGDHKASLEYMDKAFAGRPKLQPDSVFADYDTVAASHFLLRKAASERIIMLNEAHNCGQHRAFLRDVLRGLHAAGFRYLSLEALAQADTAGLQKRGYPLRHVSGFYTNEPTFGQLLREAQRLGFVLLGHDDDSDEREQKQAENIAQILLRDPKAKVLVWAGHAHVHEKTVGNDVPRMAQYFKKTTGIDPFTVDLTSLREHSAPEFESGFYRAALQKWSFNQPVVAQKGDSTFVTPSLRGAVDAQIFFPRTRFDHDYPDWMGNDETHFFDLTVEKDYFKDKLLKVFLSKEYAKEVENAVPVMNIPLSKIGTFRLFLKPEKYIAVIRDSGNWEYFYREFDVN